MNSLSGMDPSKVTWNEKKKIQNNFRLKQVNIYDVVWAYARTRAHTYTLMRSVIEIHQIFVWSSLDVMINTLRASNQMHMHMHTVGATFRSHEIWKSKSYIKASFRAEKSFGLDMDTRLVTEKLHHNMRYCITPSSLYIVIYALGVSECVYFIFFFLSYFR